MPSPKTVGGYRIPDAAVFIDEPFFTRHGEQRRTKNPPRNDFSIIWSWLDGEGMVRR